MQSPGPSSPRAARAKLAELRGKQMRLESRLGVAGGSGAALSEPAVGASVAGDGCSPSSSSSSSKLRAKEAALARKLGLDSGAAAAPVSGTSSRPGYSNRRVKADTLRSPPALPASTPQQSRAARPAHESGRNQPALGLVPTRRPDSDRELDLIPTPGLEPKPEPEPEPETRVTSAISNLPLTLQRRVIAGALRSPPALPTSTPQHLGATQVTDKSGRPANGLVPRCGPDSDRESDLGPTPISEPEPEPELERRLATTSLQVPLAMQRARKFVRAAHSAKQFSDYLVEAISPEEHVVVSMLFRAADNGTVATLQSLLDSSPPLSILRTGESGVQETVLHRLARKGKAACVELLLEHGADPFVKDSNGKTATDVAGAAGHVVVVAILHAATEEHKHLLVVGQTESEANHPARCEQGDLRSTTESVWSKTGPLQMEIEDEEGVWANGVCEMYLAETDGRAQLHVSWTPTSSANPESLQDLQAFTATVNPGVDILPNDHNGGESFAVSVTVGAPLHFCAASISERDEWVSEITLAIASHLDLTRINVAKSPSSKAPAAVEQDGARPPPTAPKRRNTRRGFGCCSASTKDEAGPATIQTKSLAVPSERVTKLLRHEDNGADPNIRGRINKLPVICVPGFCSSGLMVKHSDVMPGWINTRVWFSLQKLGRARTQEVGCTADAVAQMLTLTIHRVIDIGLSIEHDRDDIDGMAVHARLLTKDGTVLAESRTDAFRLVDASAWQGTIEYEHDIVLATDVVKSAKSVQLCLRDEHHDSFMEEGGESSEEEQVSLGTALIQLDKCLPGQQMTVQVDVKSSQSAGAIGKVVLTPGALVVNSKTKEELKQQQDAIAKASASLSFGHNRSSMKDDKADDVDDVTPKAWMHHMLLAADGHSDPPGVETRAVPGLAGCNYLQPGVMSAATWVFGHLTAHLQRVGYGPKNLKGATYDWRQPPMFLEKQSGYFSGLVRMIEKTYRENGDRPVVLLGHSMGCKMGHYFANWVVNNGPSEAGLVDPQAWLDKYIFSLYAVGGPFLGARAGLQAQLSGDDMGIGDFIGTLNTIRLSRSVGSGMFLYPEGRLRTAHPYALAYRRDKGLMRIEIVSATIQNGTQLADGCKLHVNLTHVKTAKGKMSRTVVKTIDTEGIPVDDDEEPDPKGVYVKFTWGQNYQLVSEKLSLCDLGNEQLVFQVNFLHDGDTVCSASTTVNDLFEVRNGADIAHKMVLDEDSELPPDLMRRVAQDFQVADLDVRTRTKNLKTYENCFLCGEAVEWLQLWLRDNNCEHSRDVATRLFAELQHAALFECVEQEENTQSEGSQLDAYKFFSYIDGGGTALLNAQLSPRSTQIGFDSVAQADSVAKKMKASFLGRKQHGQSLVHNDTVRHLELQCRSTGTDEEAEIVGELLLRCVWHQTDPAQLVKLDDNEGCEARPDGFEMLRDHGAQKNVDWHAEYYEKDPNYLLGGTVFRAPPLKRLMHVYGTGLDTLWSFIYRSKDGVELKKEGPMSLGVELDPTADKLGDMNYKMKDGLLYETKHTLQRLPDAPAHTVRTSGDGTVPYQSLRYTKTWDSSTFLSQTVELAGSKHEHREIMASKEFHRCLTEYLTETVAIYIIEAKDLKPMDASGLSDPYCELYAVGSKIRREKRKTAVFSKTLNPVFNERHVFGTEFDLHDIDSIIINVMDHDHSSKNDLIGRVTVNISDIVSSPTQAINGWCPLRDPDTGKGGLGVLHIHAEFEGAGQSSMGVDDKIDKAAGCRALSNISEIDTHAFTLHRKFDPLGTIDLFKEMRPFQKVALGVGLKRRMFHAGDTICKQGTLSTEFYMIEDGMCEVSISSGPAGEESEEVIGVINQGQAFGEMALVPGNPMTRTASVTAVTTVACLILTRKTFLSASNTEFVDGTVHIGSLVGLSGHKFTDEKRIMQHMEQYGEVLTAVVRYRKPGQTVQTWDGIDTVQEHTGHSWALVSFASPETVENLMVDATQDADGTLTARISSCFDDGTGERRTSMVVRRIDLAKAMASTGALPATFAQCRKRIGQIR